VLVGVVIPMRPVAWMIAVFAPMRASGRMVAVLVLVVLVRLQQGDATHEEDANYECQEEWDTIVAVELNLGQQV